MRKIGFGLIVIILFLIACTNNSPLSKDEVISEVDERMGEVESYETNVVLNVIITDLSTDSIMEDSEGKISLSMIEPTMESSSEIENNNEEINHYIVDGTAYRQIDEQAWEEAPDYATAFNDAQTLYDEVAQIIVDFKDEEDVEMEEQDDTYVFTFEGKSATIFEIFEGPYSLGLTGATPDEMEQDMRITLDKETFSIAEVTNSFSVEKNGLKLEILIDQTYEAINEIDDITIPQDVLDEAS